MLEEELAMFLPIIFLVGTPIFLIYSFLHQKKEKERDQKQKLKDEELRERQRGVLKFREELRNATFTIQFPSDWCGASVEMFFWDEIYKHPYISDALKEILKNYYVSLPRPGDTVELTVSQMTGVGEDVKRRRLKILRIELNTNIFNPDNLFVKDIETGEEFIIDSGEFNRMKKVSSENKS